MIRYPHYSRALDKIKDRKPFFIYKCRNNKCSYYVSKLNSLTPEEKIRYKEGPQSFKLRYLYRLFDFNYIPLSKDSKITTPVSLPKIRVSSHTLGLILTYYVNY